MNFEDLFYPDGTMRHTTKRNILRGRNKQILATILTKGNPYLGGSVTDFIAILQSIDYSKLERFSNVPDEISTKLLSSFLECETLIAVKFPIENVERKCRRGNTSSYDSTHTQEIEITDSQKFPKSFQSYLGNSNNKTNLV